MGKAALLFAVVLSLVLLSTGCQPTTAQQSNTVRQTIVVYGFSVEEEVMQAVPEFHEIERPFTVRDLGGWGRAYPEIIHGVWEEQIRE